MLEIALSLTARDACSLSTPHSRPVQLMINGDAAQSSPQLKEQGGVMRLTKRQTSKQWNKTYLQPGALQGLRPPIYTILPVFDALVQPSPLEYDGAAIFDNGHASSCFPADSAHDHSSLRGYFSLLLR